MKSNSKKTKRKTSDKPSVRRIWTRGHRPFVMGGLVHYVMAADVECRGPYALGQGYKGYLSTAPNGATFVSEASSGAIVGSTLKEVRADIDQGSPSVMRKQVEHAREDAKNAEVVAVEFFWKAMRCEADKP